MLLPSRILAILAVTAIPALVGMGRSSAVAPASIELVGLAGQHKTVGAADLAKLAHVEATVSVHNVNGRYRGVPLGEVLRLVDRPAGEALRGKALGTVISAEASDGYKVAFALTEVDSGYSNKMIFVADSRNGVPLDTAEGPFRLIVPDEKRPARWAKKIVRIRLVAIE